VRHRRLVIGKRSPEFQALRSTGWIDTGTWNPRIDDSCAGRRWNRQYYTWRRILHRLAVVRGLDPVRDAFPTPTNRRFPAFWPKAEDAFGQAWDYPSEDALWVNPLFSRLNEVVTKASRDGCLILVIAPE